MNCRIFYFLHNFVFKLKFLSQIITHDWPVWDNTNIYFNIYIYILKKKNATCIVINMYIVLNKNTSACCHKLDMEVCLQWSWTAYTLSSSPGDKSSIFKQRKHPNSSSEVSVESRAFCASVCWWMMPKEENLEAGFVFLCSSSLRGFSSQHHKVLGPPRRPCGRMTGESYPASCGAGRSCVCCVCFCLKFVGPKWVCPL